jgi:O-antigen/teichoic acid export membrane protein
MIVYPFRNSISDVMLPEMASLAGQARNAWVPLWQRSIVLFAILLLPMAILLGRYAELFITTVFSDKYRGAEVVFQMHCILLALSCFDVALALRAINRTRSLIVANFVCIAANIGAMVVLVPAFGSGGAGAALVFSALVGLVYLLRVLAGLQGADPGRIAARSPTRAGDARCRGRDAAGPPVVLDGELRPARRLGRRGAFLRHVRRGPEGAESR